MRGRKPGANLMVDRGLIQRLCVYASVSRADSVLEIGAGTGNLTGELAARAGRVYAIEKDPKLYGILCRRLGGAGSVSLLCADALRVSLPCFDKVVSNMPYEISRRGLERLLSMKYGLAVMVFQREYARKLAAPAGADNYRFISALAQSCSKVEVLEDVPPEAFRPAPHVCSSVVRLTQRAVPEEGYILSCAAYLTTAEKRLVGFSGAKTLAAMQGRGAMSLQQMSSLRHIPCCLYDLFYFNHY